MKNFVDLFFNVFAIFVGEIPCETIEIPANVLKIPGRELSAAYYELTIPISRLSPMTATQFRITRLGLASRTERRVAYTAVVSQSSDSKQDNDDITIFNAKVSLAMYCKILNFSLAVVANN